MLRSFRLGNHRSFRDEQELLLMPASPGDDRLVVPVAAIYGANASGKSNLLDGLRFMRDAVLNSFVQWDVEGRIPRKPFKLDASSRGMPSVFVAEMVADGVQYTYGFGLDDAVVAEEWLYSYPEKRKRVIFEREHNEIKLGSTVVDMKSKLELLKELTRPNALFLSACARLTLDPLMPVYRWFRSGLGIRALGDPSTSALLARQVEEFVSRDGRNRERLTSLLAAADVGVTGIRLEESEPLERAEIEKMFLGTYERRAKSWVAVDEEDARFPHELLAHAVQTVMRRLELRLVHGPSEEEFSLDEESAGTRNWLELLPVVLEGLDRGQVVVVDEIDTSLHPLLTARLVGLFQDEETNPNGAQLIFTTHDTSLLGTMLGDQVLERDQIWFVDKRREGASELYPLTDFKPRKDQNTERRYLVGSYGAVPILGATEFADAVLDR